MIVILLLGLGGAGAGYYLSIISRSRPQKMLRTSKLTKRQLKTCRRVRQRKLSKKPEVWDYYVDLPKLGIREAPSEEAFVERLMYRGDKVHLYEKKDGWGRITQYFVYQEGGPEVAEWVPLSGLVEQPPVITPDERKKTLLGYIENPTIYFNLKPYLSRRPMSC